jgi:hypothetical protein
VRGSVSLEHKAAKQRQEAVEVEEREQAEEDHQLADEDHAAVVAYKEKQRQLRKQ